MSTRDPFNDYKLFLIGMALFIVFVLVTWVVVYCEQEYQKDITKDAIKELQQEQSVNP